ncbi:hypothetical protein T261_1585 [Streptomyces lydicus]|nr:hypothetical protein T261_1585 [Streptomyces lydicus]
MGGSRSVVSQAGAVLLVETVLKSALGGAISAALAPWRKPRAAHDPGKVLLDVALAVAPGGDCLADAAMLRAEPERVRPSCLRSDHLPPPRRSGRDRHEGAHRDPLFDITFDGRLSAGRR